MSFVSEFISDEDRIKYGLDEIESSLRMRGKAPQRDWTIDHERGIYLREISRGREEYSHTSTWHFYWQGELMTVCLAVDDSDSDGQRGGYGWVRFRLEHCNRDGFFIPDHLLDFRNEIIADLRAVLTAYGGGIYSTKSTYETTLII